MRLFVTVGSTKFDALTRLLCEPSTLDGLHQRCGIHHITIQHGHAQVPSDLRRFNPRVDAFAFKADGLQQDMQQADVILSHAGNDMNASVA
jgi:UDP-N-acetylglucosamine transferase subunit ALG13